MGKHVKFNTDIEVNDFYKNMLQVKGRFDTPHESKADPSTDRFAISQISKLYHTFFGD